MTLERWCRLGDVVWFAKPGEGYCHTEFADGARAVARPEDTPEYLATARRLGYGDDTAQLCVEHELTHSLLAYLAHLADPTLPPHSPALWDVAHGYAGGEGRHAEEEARVLAFQAYLNGWTAYLHGWDSLTRSIGPYPATREAKRYALAILRGPAAPGCRIEVGVRGAAS